MPLLRILVAMRPHQWVKNLFVLAALVFSGHLFHPAYLVSGLSALALFCVLSGAIYLLNDVLDLENDRRHPDKCRRPIASGSLGVPTAVGTAIGLLVVVIVASHVLGRAFGWVVVVYVLLNVAYSLKLKHVVILDVMIVAAGFLLRAVGGAFAIGVPISSWFVLCTVLLALFLGFVKRRQELVLLQDGAGDHRRSLDDYSPEFLDRAITVVTAGALVAYALYTMSPEVMQRLGTRHLNLTVPFVIYGLLRYLYLVYEKGEGGSPSTTILRDLSMLVNIGLWFLTLVTVLYAW